VTLDLGARPRDRVDTVAERRGQVLEGAEGCDAPERYEDRGGDRDDDEKREREPEERHLRRL
jgi:hypothetical protein